MTTAGQSRLYNCTDHRTDELLTGELGGAGAGGGVTWPHVPLAGPWRVRLGSNTPSPLSHIHRNPLSDQGVGAVGPLRGCDPAAPHLTGCALVPVDQWPEQEPARTWTLWGVCGRRPSVWEPTLSADRTAVSGTRARPTGFSPWRPCQGCRGGDVLYQPAAAASSGPSPQPWKPHQVLGGAAGLRAKAPGLRP